MTWCVLCGCPIQRTVDGTLHDGAMEHVEMLHPGQLDDLRLLDWLASLHD